MGTSRQSPPSPELKTFSDRLNKAIAFKKIDIAVLAKEFKCAPADIKKMQNGMREPGMTKLIILARTLGCSVDYLLGLTPEPQQASIVVQADTDADKPQPSERGQISGKAEQFLAMVPTLLASDIELLVYIAEFLKLRKEKGLARLMEAVTTVSKKDAEKSTPARGIDPVDIDFEDDLDDDFEDDDDLWGEIDDDFEDEDFDEDDDFEDEDFE